MLQHACVRYDGHALECERLAAMTLEILPVVIAAAVAMVAWCVAAFSFFGMLANTRQGWTSLVFRMGWWFSPDIGAYLTEPGIAHYRRFLKAFAWFMGTVLAIALIGAVIAFITG